MAPDRELTLSELAREVGVSLPTVTREIHRGEDAGIVTVRKAGRTKLVQADRRSPFYEPLSRLLLLSFGPAALIAEAFRDIGAIEKVLIFGSWAARYEGQAGAFPRDLDVLVVGSPQRDAVYAAADRVERELGRPCQVTFRTTDQWAQPESDPFLLEVQQRPLVQALPSDGKPLR